MRAFASPRQPSYPLVASEMSSDDMKLLTEVLHIDSTSSEEASRQVLYRINRLPPRLQRSLAHRLVPMSILSATPLCSLHKSMNPYVITDIFDLVKAEVTVQFKCMDKFPDLIPPEQTQIMDNLKAIQGMWHEPSRRSQPRDTWVFQRNQCRACMLSRTAVDRSVLCNLRITLLSRTRTKRKHHAPRLLNFVDECIAHHSAWVVDLCYYSGQRAYPMKAARKQAVKAYFKAKRDSKYQYVLRDHDEAQSSNSAYQVDPSARQQQQTRESSISREEAEYDKRLDSILACYGPTMDAESARSTLASLHGFPLAPDPLTIRKVGHPSSIVSDSRSSAYVPPRDNPNWESQSVRPPSQTPSYVPPRSGPNWQSQSVRPLSQTSSYVPPRSGPNWQFHTAHLSRAHPQWQSPVPARQPSPPASRYSQPRGTANWVPQTAPLVSSYGYGQHEALTSRPPTPPESIYSTGQGRCCHHGSEDIAEEYRDLISPADCYSESEYSDDDGSWEDAPVYENPSAADTTWSMLYRPR